MNNIYIYIVYMQAPSYRNQLFDTWKVFRAAATVALYKGS